MTRQHRTAACLVSEREASESWSTSRIQSSWLKEWTSMSWSADTEFSSSWTEEKVISYSWDMVPFDFGFEFSACRDDNLADTLAASMVFF